ncbi:glycosyltransferase family 4 protein [Larkinella arboricola]
MRIIFFNHPTFLGSQSMPRFAHMLAEGMRARGHEVESWLPKPGAFRLPVPQGLKKWLGYIDQFILFPNEVRRRLKDCPADTLFVFTDNAQGPWVSLVADRPHVVHCHDFLAQQSALGAISERKTSWSGRQYQAFIHRGYSKGKNFISVSEKTREDLHKHLPSAPVRSEVVYNGLNQSFTLLDSGKARTVLGTKTGIELTAGYLLHVGGNQWYKNRRGVIEIYDAWRELSGLNLPLLMIGIPPGQSVKDRREASVYKSDIHFLSGLDNEAVRLAYAGASVFVFPSLAEGFGWPIAEAMASGCPVVTTDAAPMTEVAGEAGFLIPRQPANEQEATNWAKQAARVVNHVVQLKGAEREKAVKAGLENAKRFNANQALDQIEAIYYSLLQTEKKHEHTSDYR